MGSGERRVVGKKYLGSGLTDRELVVLKNEGLTGELEIRGGSGLGRECQPGRAVFIFKTLISSPVELNLPAAASVIYIQKDNAWQKLPADSPMSERTIRFEMDEKNPKLILESSELESGARQGGSVYLGI